MRNLDLNEPWQVSNIHNIQALHFNFITQDIFFLLDSACYGGKY